MGRERGVLCADAEGGDGGGRLRHTQLQFLAAHEQAGVVIIGTAFLLGDLLGGRLAGLFAGLVLATSPRLMLLARRIIIDIHITMWTGLVLLFFALAETRPQRRRLYLCLMYVAAGFGVLTKGPVAVFLPALVFFLYLASQKRLGDLRHMMLPVGALISLAI